jgi:heme/copper-type cytochrome/quinol oxidase subunit 2
MEEKYILLFIIFLILLGVSIIVIILFGLAIIKYIDNAIDTIKEEIKSNGK